VPAHAGAAYAGRVLCERGRRRAALPGARVNPRLMSMVDHPPTHACVHCLLAASQIDGRAAAALDANRRQECPTAWHAQRDTTAPLRAGPVRACKGIRARAALSHCRAATTDSNAAGPACLFSHCRAATADSNAAGPAGLGRHCGPACLARHRARQDCGRPRPKHRVGARVNRDDTRPTANKTGASEAIAELAVVRFPAGPYG